MAAFDTSRPTYAAGQFRLGSFAASLFGAIISWNDARVTRKALQTLTDRELDDIGLCRGDIETVASR